MPTKRERTLELLKETPALTALEIVDRLNLVPRSSDSIGQTLRDLERDGLVKANGPRRSVGSRRWALA